MLTQVGGSKGDRPPFPIGEKRSLEEMPYLDALVGMEITGRNGDVFRLVRLNIAAGLAAAAAQCMAFAYTALATSAARTFDVELAVRGGTKPINRAVGFGRPDQVLLVDNDFFWLHVDGPKITMLLGDDVTALAIGDYVDLDDDADKGKVYSGGTTFTPEFHLGTCLTTDPGADTRIDVIPYRKFR